MARFLALYLAVALVIQRSVAAAPIAPPPQGKLYHGFYYDGPATNEHDVFQLT